MMDPIQRPFSKKLTVKVWFFLYLLSLIPRLFYLWFALNQGNLKPVLSNHYWILSENILRFGTLGLSRHPSTAFEPLYPLFLAFLRLITGDNFSWMMGLQAAVVSLGSPFFYQFCLKLSGQRSVGILGSLFYSLYPYYLRHSVNHME